MQNKEMILQSKNILLNRLKGNKEYANIMAYNIFVISAFLLVKENLIKKDSNEDTLYFDYTNQRKYIKPIQDLATYIIQNSELQRNNTKVKGKNGEPIPTRIDEYVWIVNKIRDSLAHAAYSLKENKIIIDNDHTNETPSYKLKCEIPIKQLDKFVLSIITDKKLKRQTLFSYISPLLTKKDKGEKYSLSFNGSNPHVLMIEPEEYLKKAHWTKRTCISVNPNNDYNIELLNSRKMSREEAFRQTQISIAKGYPHLDKLRNDAIQEETIIDDTTNIINVLTSFFNSYSIEDTINYIYLYNYMELVFSFIDIDVLDLTNLNLNNIDFEIDNENYQTIKDKIIEVSNEYITKLNKAIENYEDNYPKVPIESIENIYNKFIQKITKYLKVINTEILKKIRNGIEHANFEEENSLIKITDKANQNEEEINASFTGRIEDWLDLTTYIENSSNQVTDLDIESLKSFLEDKDYINLIQTLEKTKKIIKPQKTKTLKK